MLTEMLACAKVVARQMEGELAHKKKPVSLLHCCYFDTFIFSSFFLGRFMELRANEAAASQLAPTRPKRKPCFVLFFWTPNIHESEFAASEVEGDIFDEMFLTAKKRKRVTIQRLMEQKHENVYKNRQIRQNLAGLKWMKTQNS